MSLVFAWHFPTAGFAEQFEYQELHLICLILINPWLGEGEKKERETLGQIILLLTWSANNYCRKLSCTTIICCSFKNQRPSINSAQSVCPVLRTEQTKLLCSQSLSSTRGRQRQRKKTQNMAYQMAGSMEGSAWVVGWKESVPCGNGLCFSVGWLAGVPRGGWHASEDLEEMNICWYRAGGIPSWSWMWFRVFRMLGSRKPERHPTFLLKRVYPALKPGVRGLNHPPPLSSKTLLQSVIIYFRVESQ